MILTSTILLVCSRRKHRHQLQRIGSQIGLLLLPLVFCSCTSLSGIVENRQHSEDPAQMRTAQPSEPQQVTAPVKPAPAEAPGVVRIQQSQPTPALISQASAVIPAQPQVPPGYGPPEFTPNVARIPLPPHLPAEELAKIYPDEYLWDGGDRGLPVHFDPMNRHGLETEDTIIEYTDEQGNRHVKPTNEVAIYAPRFASLRTISSPVEGSLVNQAMGSQALMPGAGLNSRLVLSAEQRTLNPAGVRMRSRVSGLENLAAEDHLSQATRLDGHIKMENLYQGLSFLKSGEFDQNETARLGYGIQAAQFWGQANSTVIMASSSAGMEIYASTKPLALVGVEDKKTPADLRIVKLADKKAAAPGDIVTFTIRYDNLGDEALYHVRIIDNLTPRLEYVEDSADSNRAGRLDVVDNDEGSLILKFILDEPLKGHEGGVITFQCKVR